MVCSLRRVPCFLWGVTIPHLRLKGLPSLEGDKGEASLGKAIDAPESMVSPGMFCNIQAKVAITVNDSKPIQSCGPLRRLEI